MTDWRNTTSAGGQPQTGSENSWEKSVIDYSKRHIDRRREPTNPNSNAYYFYLAIAAAAVFCLVILPLIRSAKYRYETPAAVKEQVDIATEDPITKATFEVYRPFPEKPGFNPYLQRKKNLLSGKHSILVYADNEFTVLRFFQQYEYHLGNNRGIVIVDVPAQKTICEYVSPIRHIKGVDCFQNIFTRDWHRVFPSFDHTSLAGSIDWPNSVRYNVRMITQGPQLQSGTADYRFAAMQLSKKIRQRDALARQSGLPARRFGLQRSRL
ncbi:MAG: hypothetical protein WC717_04615 [Candidatus Micrarchaeia archaeon]|jgi:hypothetical protein